ncbi:hypothetical protein HDU87_001755 [Geranomyces variabilis]|uniref:Uncharacterized protein n=1 Tax=Geranomyces variabilis TaxID=109894 RepID=A0AAD5TMH2_9FUNG|nr:hypothetical protein HDU87_001755 [Geranomyces variabilis]
MVATHAETAERGQDMGWIIVKYGANEERLANPNVISSVLLHHLKTTCGFGDLSENVDLASETGEVLDLLNKSKEYAKRFVDPRGTYILVKVQGDETDDASPTYTSLLEQNGVEKVKFSVSRQRNKLKANARGDAPTRRGDKDDADSSSNQAPAGNATGAAAKRGAAASKSVAAKGSTSSFSSTTSLYEAASTTAGARRGKVGSTPDKSSTAASATSASSKSRKK